MANRYDAIVIGAGIGGLGAAVMLAHQKKRVLLLEKTKYVGGRLMSYKRDGFTVDLGVHVISQSYKGPLGQVMERVGKPLDIQFTLIRPITSFHGEQFIFPKNLKTKVNEREFDAVMQAMQDIRGFSEEEVSSYDGISTKEWWSKYISDPLSYACVNNISTIYVCLPHWLSSAGEFMRCMRAEARSKASGYPEGGCGAISSAYINAFTELGGEYKLESPVTNIDVSGGRVKGVYCGEAYYETDTVVSNGDIKGTILEMLDEGDVSAEYADYVRGLTYSWSGPIVRLALDKVMMDAPMLTQIGTTDPEGYYEDLARGVIADELNFFAVSPSNFSPNVAPPGKQLVNIGPAMPLTTPLSAKEDVKEAFLRTFEKYAPGFRDHLLWMEYIYFDSLTKMLGEQGAGIGIGQTPAQVGKNRPKIKTPVEGLYIVGAEAGGSGVGIELALNSAMEYIDNYT